MTVRINIRRLLGSLVTSLIVPLVLAVFIDMQIGWFPLITIGAMVIFIPLSTVVVVRAALAEMEQLIQKVAPLPAEVDDAVYENSSAIGESQLGPAGCTVAKQKYSQLVEQTDNL